MVIPENSGVQHCAAIIRRLRTANSLPMNCFGGDILFVNGAGLYISIMASAIGAGWRQILTTGSTTLLTVGSIPFATFGGQLVEDNANLFWNNTSKGLGVGTATPGTYKIYINGTTFHGAAVIPAVIPLVEAAGAVATNAALGNYFRVTLNNAANPFTLSNPSNPIDGQTITWEIIQPAAGNETIAYGASFLFCTSLPVGSCVLSLAGLSHDFLVARYNATLAKWLVLAFNAGYPG